MIMHSFETRPGLGGRPETGTEPDWRKNKEKKNPVTRSKSGTRALDRVGHRTGSKNYAIMTTNNPWGDRKWFFFFFFCGVK